MLPSIQNTLNMQGRANFTVMDRRSNGPHPGPKLANYTVEDLRSSGPQWNPEVENSQKSWEKRPKTCFTQENSRFASRQSSIDSDDSEQNRNSSLHDIQYLTIVPCILNQISHKASLCCRFFVSLNFDFVSQPGSISFEID